MRDIHVGRPSGGLSPRWHVWAASTFIIAFLLPNLWGLVIPYEAFPYSSAPMFAHYIGDDTPRYRFRFVAETQDREREIHANDLGLSGVEFTRYFFGHVYGSIASSAPVRIRGEDTPVDFEARLSEFFGNVQKVLERRGAIVGQSSHIRLEVIRLDANNRDTETHIIGRYDTSTGRFARAQEDEF